jgi:hypothetical protein
MMFNAFQLCQCHAYCMLCTPHDEFDTLQLYRPLSEVFKKNIDTLGFLPVIKELEHITCVFLRHIATISESGTKCAPSLVTIPRLSTHEQ